MTEEDLARIERKLDSCLASLLLISRALRYEAQFFRDIEQKVEEAEKEEQKQGEKVYG